MAARPIDRILNVAVSAAAVPVLFGALQKILHSPSADLWLKIGLYTECAIFAAYALLYLIAPPKEADWTKLDGLSALPKANAGNPALAKMDQMMMEADITPASLTRLSDNFKKLGGSVDQMSDITNVVAATGDFTTQTKAATAAITTMKGAYEGAAATMQSFNDASEGTKNFHSQVQVLTKNLGSLNTIYELELQDTNNHLKAMNQFYGHLANASEAMKGSVDDAKKTQEQMGVLAKNLGSLNSVYGNMLSAMQGRA
jgi:gliding motility-associated protein GldL